MSDPLSGVGPSYLRVRGAPDPLASFRALYGGERYGFLYESLSSSGDRGRYSFLGGRPLLVLTGRGGAAALRGPGREPLALEHEPLDLLAELLASGVDALPVASFPGGAVGYLAYDVARRFLPLGPGPLDDLGWPDLAFLFPSEIVVLDHLDEVAHIVVYGRKSRAGRCAEIAKTVARERVDGAGEAGRAVGVSVAVSSNMRFEEYVERVERIRDHIREGDAYQVVLSRRFELEGAGPPLELYAALRRRNPSPYMYYLALDGRHLAGSSPETLVKLSGRRVTVRPLAGTRPRGGSDAEDDAVGRELLGDPKERAEHVMLVDLARNDVGRVCEIGSVALRRLMDLERYASVMHLTSDVEGRLREDRNGFDLLRACFPAGTVSGAPKIRAMQLIDELEPTRRGPYAGAIGYFSFLGDLDLCIAIRTVILERERAWLQAGAGIVADSDPRREFEETASKAGAILGALRTADRATMGPCGTAADDSTRARSAGSTG